MAGYKYDLNINKLEPDKSVDFYDKRPDELKKGLPSLVIKQGSHARVTPRKVAPVPVEPTSTEDLKQKSLTVYHVTPTRNVASIRKSGLIPRHGKPTQGENPAYNAVYFHTARGAADGFNVGDEPKTVLKVKIPLTRETARRFRPDEDTFHKSAAESVKAKSSIAYCGTIPPEWIE
mgnify:CR=1 FL=1